ncbi:MAG: hypothetical protein SOW34_02310 [Oliverpabstia sp.]|nr:hypothetical protein [Oliverpabstia sp.]
MALYAYTRQDKQLPVRRLYPEEIQSALDLCWEVFLQYEAPEYSEEGIQEFLPQVISLQHRCFLEGSPD